jgi:arsenate reductase (glutaredoxin)
MEGVMATTIYHNPACGTSRNTLAIIRATGEEPTVVEYLSDPPSRERLIQLMQDAELTPRDVLREKGTPYAELGLGDPTLTDKQLVDAMMAHPILINRPLVETARGVRLCRPSEVVLDILERPLTADFVKEDGEVVTATKSEV